MKLFYYLYVILAILVPPRLATAQGVFWVGNTPSLMKPLRLDAITLVGTLFRAREGIKYFVVLVRSEQCFVLDSRSQYNPGIENLPVLDDDALFSFKSKEDLAALHFPIFEGMDALQKLLKDEQNRMALSSDQSMLQNKSSPEDQFFAGNSYQTLTVRKKHPWQIIQQGIWLARIGGSKDAPVALIRDGCCFAFPNGPLTEILSLPIRANDKFFLFQSDEDIQRLNLPTYQRKEAAEKLLQLESKR